MSIHKTQYLGSDRILRSPLTNTKCITVTTIVALLALGGLVIGIMAIHGSISQIGWSGGITLTTISSTAFAAALKFGRFSN